jgi:hypothetical protein
LRTSTMARPARKSPMQRRWGLFTLSMVIMAVVSGTGASRPFPAAHPQMKKRHLASQTDNWIFRAHDGDTFKSGVLPRSVSRRPSAVIATSRARCTLRRLVSLSAFGPACVKVPPPIHALPQSSIPSKSIDIKLARLTKMQCTDGHF